jgi:peptide/nickel transport system substrate-binding protein
MLNSRPITKSKNKKEGKDGRMLKKFGVVVSMLLAVALLLSGCGPQAQTGPKEPEGPTLGGSITYGMTGDPVIFNPILSTDTPSGFVNTRVYSGLLRSNENLEMIGDLAESWSFSEDGLVWTFKLKQGVKFHDGQPLTSADVKYTYEAIKHPDYQGVRATDFKPIEKIEAPDDYTVVLTLKEPYAPLLTKLTYGILPKHIYETTPIGEMKQNPANMEPIGSGPYKYKEWQKSQHIILEANEDYFGDGPYIEQVIIKFYQDEQVMLAALEKGDIDYMGSIPVDDIERIKGEYSDRLNFQEVPANGYTYIGLKQTHPILKDVTVRKALMYGLNRQQIVDDLLQGYGTLMNANIAPVSWAYAEGELEEYKYDVEKAKALLEDAGWKEGADGIREKDGKKLAFDVLTSSGSTVNESVILLAQEDWKKIGVDINPQFIEWSVLCDQYLDVAQFEAYLLSWSLGLDPDFYLFFHSDSAVNEEGQLVGFNDVEFKNEELDRLLEEGRTEMDQEKRKQIYWEAQKIINDELPYVFLFSRNYVSAMNKKVEGVVWSTLGPMFPEKWYIK